MSQGFFSVSAEMIIVDQPIPYDLWVNTLGGEGVQRFVPIFLKGEVLCIDELNRMIEKYRQLYVAEANRNLFLSSYCEESAGTVIEKTTVLKESAIHHLNTLFEKEPTTEVLTEVVQGCRDDIEGMLEILHDYNIDQLRELIASLNFHDSYTFDHSINVAMYSILLYKACDPDASREQVVLSGICALLHDLGKVRVPTELLNKPGRLSETELKEMQRHPKHGLDLLLALDPQTLNGVDPKVLARVAAEHHENFDGSGYPHGLKGEQIHLIARITAVADFFDAITTKRSYHEPLGVNEAIAVMEKSVGRKLDPSLFWVFTDQMATQQARKATRLELPSDFDPCQPHDHLPFTASCTSKSSAGPSNFGKIRIISAEAERGRVQSSSRKKSA